MAPPKQYDINANRGPILYVSVWTIAAIAVLVVVGRFVSRKMKGQRWWIDDWMALVALILALGCCICSTISVSFGIGRHLEALKSSFSPIPFWKLLFAYNQIYVMTGPVNKIAMLLMYWRIFDTPFFTKVVRWGIVINIAWWLGMSISGIFTCIPVQAYWLTDTPGKRCFTLLPYDLGYAIVNITLDVFILVLPIREVWRLKLSRSQKVAVSFVFLIGAFACITALIRLLTSILYVNDPDFTWVYLDALIWTAIEPLVAVISICLPILRPILQYILPSRLNLSSFMRSEERETQRQLGTLITIGSFRPKNPKRRDDLGFTLYDDDDDRASQKPLHHASHRNPDNGNPLVKKKISYRHNNQLRNHLNNEENHK